MYNFDYNDFKKELKFSANIPIDRSGVPINPDSKGFTKDTDTGEIVETNMNEIKDEYVNLIYENDVTINGITYLSGESVEENDDIKLYWGEDNLGPPVLEDSDGKPINIIPRHELMRDDYSNEEYRSFQIDREIYAALGMWSTNGYTIDVNDDNRNTLGIEDDEALGYISKEDFENRLTQLQDILKTKNIGTSSVRYYEEKMVEINGKFVDINKSKLSKDSKFKYAQLYGMGSSRYNTLFDTSETGELGFINRKIEGKDADGNPIESEGLDLGMSPIESDEVSPFSLSVKEIVKARFDKTELKNELSVSLENVINNSDKRKELISEIEAIDPTIITDTSKINIKTLSGKDGIITATTETPHGYANRVKVTIRGAKESGFNKRRTRITVIDPNPDNITFTYKGSGEGTATGDITSKRRNEIVINFDSATHIQNIIDIVNEYQPETSDSFLSINTTLILFETVINKIIWYERYTNESIFPDRTFISEPEIRTFTQADKMMARVLIPVDLGVKQGRRKKKKWWQKGIRFISNRWFQRKTINQGIIWARIEFIDASVFDKYRINETPSGENIIKEIPVTATKKDNQISLTPKSGEKFTDIVAELKDKIVVGVKVEGVTPKKYSGTFNAVMETTDTDTENIKYTLNGTDEISEDPSGDDIKITRIITEFAPTKQEETPEQVNVSFEMPNLPSPDAIRKKAFSMFGQFEQADTSNRIELEEYLPITVTDNLGTSFETREVPSGYQIFYDSSKEISDMRQGVDLYNKVQFLLQILKSEFNDTRVKLIETTRSLRDQDKLQMGSTESNFLSWHNFGLSVKILITEQGGTELIKRDTPDFYKLMDIAEVFLEGCKQGKFGKPMNVVWCEQLVLGADMFVWEFLPIGVFHRDSWKFRQAAYNQQDPVLENAYVNITEKKYVIDDDDPIPNTPFIRKGSSAYQNAIVINKDRWVHPSEINQYNTPSDLILINLQEFLYLVENKFNAHGTELSDLLVTQWREQNPISFNQLMMYNALTGNFAVTTALLAIDYIDKYRILINSLSQSDPIEFVKQFLGETEYKKVKIKLQNAPDGSFITLYNGKITILLADSRSTHPQGSGNIFGERQVDENSAEFGYYDKDGLFIADNGTNIPIIESENSVIDGYTDQNEPVSGDAEFLHILIKSQILKEADRIKSLYENLNTKFLYDDLLNSPNKTLLDTLENEFGVIKTQTLTDLTDVMPIPQIRDMYKKLNINNTGDKVGAGDTQNLDIDTNPNTNSNADGSLNQSVFEKLISNAQLMGVQRANITKEKPVIEPLQNDVTIERIMRFVKNNNTDEPDVRDIL